jgi:hypothetical protein
LLMYLLLLSETPSILRRNSSWCRRSMYFSMWRSGRDCPGM